MVFTVTLLLDAALGLLLRLCPSLLRTDCLASTGDEYLLTPHMDRGVGSDSRMASGGTGTHCGGIDA